MSLVYGCGRVVGDLHEERGMACEDAVGVWCDARHGKYVGVVADGHGDPTCVRSAKGAQLAVDVAIECLRDFTGENDARVLAGLAKRMVKEWKHRVFSDLQERPIEQDELGNMSRDSIELWRRSHPAHLYGSTIVAVLLTSEYCAFFQQGDGLCALVCNDGTITYPMPADDKCVGNLTTSLSDDDAEDCIRFCRIALSENQVMGLFVATDGVDKSYVAREHLDAFFREIIVGAQHLREEALCVSITEMLADVSKFGSRDDASLACVIDNRVSPATVDYLRRVNDSLRLRYELTETREKLVSMSRKHDLLREQSLNGDEEATREYAAYHATWQNLCDCERDLAEQISAIDAASDEPQGGGACLTEFGTSELEDDEERTEPALELEDDEERTEPMPDQEFIDERASARSTPTEYSASGEVMPSTTLDGSSGEKADHGRIRLLVWLVILFACVCGAWVLMASFRMGV